MEVCACTLLQTICILMGYISNSIIAYTMTFGQLECQSVRYSMSEGWFMSVLYHHIGCHRHCWLEQLMQLMPSGNTIRHCNLGLHACSLVSTGFDLTWCKYYYKWLLRPGVGLIVRLNFMFPDNINSTVVVLQYWVPPTSLAQQGSKENTSVVWTTSPLLCSTTALRWTHWNKY